MKKHQDHEILQTYNHLKVFNVFQKQPLNRLLTRAGINSNAPRSGFDLVTSHAGKNKYCTKPLQQYIFHVSIFTKQ